MATTCTGAAIGGASITRAGLTKTYEMTLDTTDANGEMTWDLTADFKYVDGAVDVGSDGTTGYVVQIEKPADGTAITSTNVKVGIYEAGADAAPLDPVASTDVSASIPGLTIQVTGLPAIQTSWA